MARIGIDARLTYYRHGGIAQYIHHLIDELPALDTQNEYFILHQRKDRRNLAQAPNQRRVTCWTPAHHRFERLAMAVETFPLRLDVLHSPDFIPPVNGRYRSVITVHDLTFLHYPQFLTADSRRYYNDQIEAAVARANHIMTDSEATRADVLRLLSVPPEKVTTVLLGISGHFHPAAPSEIEAVRARYRLPSDYILFVGTFEPRKNLSGLINAYQLLRERVSDTPALVAVGQRGWLDHGIFDLVDALNLSEAFLHIEDVDFNELPAIYSAANLLCLPSFYEGFGFPPLEAMACGTPVIVADRASLPEVVGSAGVYVDPDSPESIAEALERVLTDSELSHSLRQRGLERVKLFDWSETARQVLEVYQKVLGNA